MKVWGLWRSAAVLRSNMTVCLQKSSQKASIKAGEKRFLESTFDKRDNINKHAYKMRRNEETL